MSLTEDERRTIVRLELEESSDTYEEIEILRQAKKFNGAATRVYYAVFHVVNALFIHDGLRAVTHKGSHLQFSQYYVKTGKLPIEFGRFYNNLQTLREKSEYNCFYNVTEQDIIDSSAIAKQLIEAIEKLIAN